MSRRGNRSEKKSASLPRPSSRTRLAFVGLAIAAVITAVALALWRPRQSVAHGAFAGRNLLFVTIDTLRPDRLGSYGSKAGLTPNLDRLASEL